MLQRIIVDPENTVLQTIDGNLYTKDGKTFIYYCVAKEDEDFILPSSVTTIKAMAFAYCATIQNITLSNSLKTVEDYAFRDCKNLVSINLPEGLTTVKKSAFLNCSSLSAITFPSTLTILPEEMLKNCDSLTSLEIPATVNTIEYGAIYCKNLTSVTFANKDGWIRKYKTDTGSHSEEISSELLKDEETAATTVKDKDYLGTWIYTN